MSFVVIAQFWLVHHRVLRGMRGHSEGLAWRNFGFLLTLTLMPFTSDLIGRYGSNPLAITFFGINLMAISLTTQWIFLYAATTTCWSTSGARPTTNWRDGSGAILVVVIVLAYASFWPGPTPPLAKYGWLLFLLVPALAGGLSIGGRGNWRSTPRAADAGRLRDRPRSTARRSAGDGGRTGLTDHLVSSTSRSLFQPSGRAHHVVVVVPAAVGQSVNPRQLHRVVEHGAHRLARSPGGRSRCS